MIQGGEFPHPETATLDDISKFCVKFFSFDSQEIIKFVAIRCQILRLKCTKFDFGWGSAPAIPSWGAYSAPPDPVAGLRALRLRRGEGKDGGGASPVREG